jgi:hypothetical protein
MGGKDNDLSAAVGSGISGYATPPFDELDNGSGDNGSGDNGSGGIDGRARRGDSPFRGTPIPGSPRCNEDGYVREPTTPPPPSFDSPPPCAATPSPIRTPINSTSGNQTPINSTSGNQTPINSTSGNQTPINSTSGDTPEAREQGESFSTPNGAPQQQQHQQQQHDDFVTPPETPTSTPASPTLSSAGAGSGEGAGAAISIDVTAGTPSPCTPPPTDFAFPRDGRSAAGYASERPRQQMSGRCTDMYNRHLAEGASAEKKILELVPPPCLPPSQYHAHKPSVIRSIHHARIAHLHITQVMQLLSVRLAAHLGATDPETQKTGPRSPPLTQRNL